MKSFILSFLLVFSLGILALPGCGSSAPEPEPEVSVTLSPKAAGLQCFEGGDVSCAAENYCSLPEDGEAAFRCCLARLLEVYFSENTQELGRMLGYEPLGVRELRQLSREEILKRRAAPFGELFLNSQGEGKKYGSIVGRWLQELSAQQASSQELNSRLIQLGVDLEAGYQCLHQGLAGFSEDSIDPEVWAADSKLSVNQRDLRFAKFFLGTLSYVLQTLPQYQWGFDTFPALPLDDDFFADVNGQVGEGDARLGDLSQGAATEIVGNFFLLVSAFEDLKTFSQLPAQASRIDAYLNWRFETGSQEYLSGILKAVYLSLQEDGWQAIPGEDWQLNFFGLSEAGRLPDGRKVDRNTEAVLVKENGGPELNEEFLKLWVEPVLRSN